MHIKGNIKAPRHWPRSSNTENVSIWWHHQDGLNSANNIFRLIFWVKMVTFLFKFHLFFFPEGTVDNESPLVQGFVRYQTGRLHNFISPQMSSWWRHPTETFSALLDIRAGNSPVTGEFPAQRPVTWSFDVLFDLCLNKWLSKQSWGWWLETLLRLLWRHCNVMMLLFAVWDLHNIYVLRN